jgi:hypothetical protein
MLRFDVVAVGARSSSRSRLAAASWVSRNGSSYVFCAVSASALHLHNRNDPAHVPTRTSSRTHDGGANGQKVMTDGSGVAGGKPVERLAGFEHAMHDDGELPRHCDGCALEPELFSQLQPPGAQRTVGDHSREDRRCRLIKQSPQMNVPAARDMAAIINLA